MDAGAGRAAGSLPHRMLSWLDLRGFEGDLATALPRPPAGGAEPAEAVRQILADVRERGDDAVRELTRRFDQVDVDDLRVTPAELDAALGRIPADLRAALEVAADAIDAYHRTQVHPTVEHERNGVSVRSIELPVGRAGCYVPGGRAVYPSTVLMTAVPAKVAGVPEVVLVAPPDRATGLPPDATLAAAAIAGVDEVYRVGGAQAMAALAYGTASIRAVDVIVGPGNVYVAAAPSGSWPARAGSVSRAPSPVRARWWSSPTGGHRSIWPPSTSSCRPSTGPTAWRGWSPGTRSWPRRSPTRSRPTSPVRRARARSSRPSAPGATRCWSTGPSRPWPSPTPSPPSTCS